MKVPKSQKGFLPIILLIIVIIMLSVSGGVYYLNKNSNIHPASQALNPVEAEKNFMKQFLAKYPEPSTQVIPSGLEDQLFQILLQARRGFNSSNRPNFKVEKYYGDVATGTTGTAHWEMNKIDDKWVLISLGQEAPRCEDLKPFINNLKDWQALCFTSDLEKGSRLIDGKHPNETYNKY